jgi:hypothetical protein
VVIPTTSWDDASLTYNKQEGGPPAPYVDSGASNNFLFWAEGFLQGADMYSQAIAPDGGNWLMTVEDDYGSGGNYAGCAEASPQAPQYGCVPTWNGTESNVQTSFTYLPTATAPSTAVGQMCERTFASEQSQPIDCANDADAGVISPLNFIPGETPVVITLTGTGPTAVNVGLDQNVIPNCTLGGQYTQPCSLPYDDNDGAHLWIWPVAGQPVGEGSIEVTGLSVGTDPQTAPTTPPNVGVVDHALRPGDALKPGQVALVGGYRVAMRTDGELAEYAGDGDLSYKIFGSGTSVPGSRMAVAADGHVVVHAPNGRTLWSSPRAAASTGAAPRTAVSRPEGNLVLWSPTDRRLWSHGPVTGPLRVAARRGVARLASGHGLATGGTLVAGRQRLTMRPDGDLVLTRGGRQRWSARTGGHPGAYLILRPGGDLVVDSFQGRTLWSSRSGGHRGARLQLRAGRRGLTLTARNGRTLWKAATR